jgi:Protein of unknown function (DUF2934)
MQDLEQTIRERAYQLWIENGCEHGNADAHWLTAQREVLCSSLSSLGRVTVAAKTPKVRQCKSASRKKSAA